jgi:hypothetical protein
MPDHEGKRRRCTVSRFTPSFVAVLCAAAILLGTSQKSGKNKGESDKPFAVFIYEPKEDTPEVKGLTDATEEVKKKFAKRDKWFQLVEDALDAEMRIEVLKAWNEKELRVRGSGSVGSTGSVTRTTFDHGERRMYYIEFSYSIPGQFENIVRVEGINLGEAAKKIPRMIKTICDTYCR